MPNEKDFIVTVKSVEAPKNKQGIDAFQKDISELLTVYFPLEISKFLLIERLQALGMEVDINSDSQIDAYIKLNKRLINIAGFYTWDVPEGSVHIVFTFIDNKLTTFKAIKYFSKNSPFG